MGRVCQGADSHRQGVQAKATPPFSEMAEKKTLPRKVKLVRALISLFRLLLMFLIQR